MPDFCAIRLSHLVPALLFCCLASSLALAQPTLLDKSGWQVVCAADTAPNPRDITVSVEGQPRGRCSELKIHYRIGSGFPQVFSVKGSGALRPALPGGEFGGTFYATGYWETAQQFVQNLFITELDARVEDRYPFALRLGGKASNLTSMEAADFTLTFSPPSGGAVRVAAGYTLVATRAFTVDASRQAQHEGFRIARIASSFISAQTHDSDQAGYLDATGKIVRVNLRNENGLIFASPQPMGRSRLMLIHAAGKPRKTPTLSIKFSEPALPEITPQGFDTRSNDPNDDNVDCWANWDRAKAQYAQGERIGRFAFTLEAAPPGATAPSFDEPAPIRDGELVARSGSRLLLNNQEFRFAGNNAYYLQPHVAYGEFAEVRESLDKLATLGMTVARTIGFNDNPSPANNSRCPGLQTNRAGEDPATIQFAPGVFCEMNLVALDQAVAEARARDIRLIVYLTNFFPAYGGVRRYVEWKLNRPPRDDELNLFYTDAAIRQWFRNYLSMLLNRRNTITGSLYKDEPAILAWELGNELRNPASNVGDRVAYANDLLNWMREMSDHIRSIDARHLVGDGGEGFDDDATLYAGIGNTYPVRGDTSNSFHRMIALSNIDLASYHLYPASWGLNDERDVEIWISRHEQLARAAGKVAYLGEYGKRPNNQQPVNCDRAPGRAFDPARATLYDRWLELAVCAHNTSGHLLWQLFYDSRPDCDGYAVYYPEDKQVVAVLQKYSGLTVAPPIATVSAASYGGAMLAPESIAALFGAKLAGAAQSAASQPLPAAINGTRALVKDSAGVERASPLFFAAPAQINLLIPPGTANGLATVTVKRDDQFVSCSSLMISTVAPGLFTANATGQGVAAANVLRVRGGVQTIEPIARFDPSLGRFVPVPIDLGPESDQVFLVLYGTGFRFRSSLSAVAVQIGGANAEALYAGPQNDFAGLDQSNVRLPRSLMGRGEVDVAMTVDGKAANVVRISIK